MESSLNNFVGNLSDAETWLGARELIPHGTGTLSLNLSSATDLVLTISQSLDGSNFVWTDNFNHVNSIFGSVTRTQIPVKGSFAKVSLLNVSGGPATNVILSTFFSPNGIDATIEQPSRIAGSVDVLNGMKATEKVFNTLRDVACDDTGHLLVNINTPITSTGDLIVNGSSSSATRPVYLMEVGTFYRVASVGNTSGAVWNAIGAVVGGETEPTIGRFFKCLSVPANIEGQGTVYDVEFTDTINVVSVGGVQAVSGTISVDNFPVTQPISGSVSLLASADPTIALGKVRLTDSYGDNVSASAGNLMVGINNVYTTNPLHTIVDSGSVSLLASADPTIELGKVRLTDSYGAGISASGGNLMVGISNIYTANPLHTIVDSGSITTTERASLIVSFGSVGVKTNIKMSAGSLQSLSLVNDNTALAFVALYNALAVDVVLGTTAPLAVIVVQKDQAIQLVNHNLAFSTALCYFTATTYNGTVSLANVYLTASYN